MDEATKKGWITITVPFEEVTTSLRRDGQGDIRPRESRSGKAMIWVRRDMVEVQVLTTDLHEAIGRAWPARSPGDRSWWLANMAERHAEIEARGGGITMSGMEGERAHRDRRDLLREIHAADAALAALGVPDDGRPLAERTRAFEADMRATMGVQSGSLLGAARDGEEAWGEVVAERDRLQAEVNRLRGVIATANNALVDVCHGDHEHQIECHANTLPEEHRRVATAAQTALDALSPIVLAMVDREVAEAAARCARGEHRKAGETMPLACADCGVDFADLEDEARPPASVPPPDAIADDPREGPMHDWFGLTRASHLVLPRVVIQSMTVPWQRQLVGLLEQARAACETAGVGLAGSYYVRALDSEGRLTDEDLPHYRHAPLLGDPAWADAPRATRDEDDPVELEREEATDEAFAEAVRIVERLKGRVVASPEEMRQAALVALTLRSSDLEQFAADPARRAVFNAHPDLPPRIAVLDPATHPLRPGAARMREHLNGSFASLADKPIQLADLAKALRIREEDMRAIEAGEKTTNAAGWTEIQTVLFMLGAGTPAEEIADPIGSGALDRALARTEEPDPLAEHFRAEADREDAARPDGGALIAGAMPRPEPD